jgi:hypothetical protein
MATTVRSVRSALYEGDFAAWAEAQADALRAGRTDQLDLPHLAEEIGDLSNRERDALEPHLETLVMHLLKWRHQPDRCSRSWEATIRIARRNIAKLLRRSPSLRRGLQASLDEIYPNARIRAAVATRLPTMPSPPHALSPWIRSPGSGCPEERAADASPLPAGSSSTRLRRGARPHR